MAVARHIYYMMQMHTLASYHSDFNGDSVDAEEHDAAAGDAVELLRDNAAGLPQQPPHVLLIAAHGGRRAARSNRIRRRARAHTVFRSVGDGNDACRAIVAPD